MAHELGHQFNGNHTFNGSAGSCGGNGNAATSVEPGSGTSIQAYAGICAQDNLQPHSDPYFSQRSQTEVTSHITAATVNFNEVQEFGLSGFDGTDGLQARLRRHRDRGDHQRWQLHDRRDQGGDRGVRSVAP